MARHGRRPGMKRLPPENHESPGILERISTKWRGRVIFCLFSAALPFLARDAAQGLLTGHFSGGIAWFLFAPERGGLPPSLCSASNGFLFVRYCVHTYSWADVARSGRWAWVNGTAMRVTLLKGRTHVRLVV
ncbi:hypothetical protein N656DRAFT_460939 [Canariomyces notabilis]|uniref:Uncharacterized protein n=1 Tax=Canariomyces notabilis TaxID=2074819 RepID=A0AAN6T866_9PEZI|nr:hypothetical protein N656DRAFT_460939 [Canariomyces arenarius]